MTGKTIHGLRYRHLEQIADRVKQPFHVVGERTSRRGFDLAVGGTVTVAGQWPDSPTDDAS